MIIVVIILFFFIAISDFPGLIKYKKWYEVSLLSGFFLFAFVFAIFQSLGATIPSPIKGVEFIIKDVLHLYYH